MFGTRKGLIALYLKKKNTVLDSGRIGNTFAIVLSLSNLSRLALNLLCSPHWPWTLGCRLHLPPECWDHRLTSGITRLLSPKTHRMHTSHTFPIQHLPRVPWTCFPSPIAHCTFSPRLSFVISPFWNIHHLDLLSCWPLRPFGRSQVSSQHEGSAGKAPAIKPDNLSIVPGPRPGAVREKRTSPCKWPSLIGTLSLWPVRPYTLTK